MGSKSPAQVTQTNTPPPQVLAQYGKVVAQANDVAQTPYQSYSGELVAPFNGQQNTAVSGVNNYANAAQGGIGAGMGLTLAGAGPANAQQFSGQALGQYLSPYQSQVIAATQAQMQNQDAQQAAQLQGNTISAGAFGGDRAGVAQAALAGQQDIANNSTLANLNNQNYTQALGEFNNQQTTNLSAEQANLAREQTAGAQLGSLATAGQTAGLQGASAQLQAGTLQQQTQQAQDTAAYNQFLQQQAYPFQTTGWLANISEGIGSNSGGTSTSTQSAPSAANSIAGAGVLGLGLYNSGALSGIGSALGGLALLKDGGAVEGRKEYAAGGLTLPIPYASAETGEQSWVPETAGLTMGRGMGIPSAQQQMQQQSPVNAAAQQLQLMKAAGALGNKSGGLGGTVAPTLDDSGLLGDSLNGAANGGAITGRAGFDIGGAADASALAYDPNALGVAPSPEVAALVQQRQDQALQAAAAGSPDAGQQVAPQQTAFNGPVSDAPAPGVSADAGGNAGQASVPVPPPRPAGLGPVQNVNASAPAGLVAPDSGRPQSMSIPRPSDRESAKAFMASQGYPMSENWCGEYAASVVKANGIEPPKGAAVASNWLNWGQHVDPKDVQPGDIAVRKTSRYGGDAEPGEVGSHVGFVDSVNGGAVNLLAGNQSRDIVAHNADEFEYRRPVSGGGSALAYAGNSSSDAPASRAINDASSPTGLSVYPQQHVGKLGLSDASSQALIAAGLGIMASPSRNFGMALGQGGLQGVSAYNTALEQERRGLLANSSVANTNSEIATRKGQLGISQQEVGLRAKQLQQQADQFSRELAVKKSGLGIEQQNADTQRQNVESEVGARKADVATKLQTATPAGLLVRDPNNPAAAPRLVPWDQVAGGAPQAPAAPIAPAVNKTIPGSVAPAPVQAPPGATVAAPQRQSALQGVTPPVDPRLFSPEGQKLAVEEATKTLDTARTAYEGSQNTKYQLEQMKHALDQLPPSGFLAPGTGFSNRVAVANQINTTLRNFGVKDENLVQPDAVAAGEELKKLTNRMGFDLAKTLGGREPGFIVQQAVGSVPSGDNSPLGAKRLIAGIGGMAQRQEDWYNFAQEWSAKTGGSVLGAADAFNKAHPPEGYVRDAILSTVPPQAVEMLRQNPKLAPQFDAKYGQNVSRYVLGQ